MKTSLITNPTTPITANPRAHDPAIFKNSNQNIIKFYQFLNISNKYDILNILISNKNRVKYSK